MPPSWLSQRKAPSVPAGRARQLHTPDKALLNGVRRRALYQSSRPRRMMSFPRNVPRTKGIDTEKTNPNQRGAKNFKHCELPVADVDIAKPGKEQREKASPVWRFNMRTSSISTIQLLSLSPSPTNS